MQKSNGHIITEVQVKRILMIGTGGTIASRQTASGLSPSILPQDVLSYIPEVERICVVDTLQVCNLDSTSMQPQHWLLMARTIEELYDAYDGFVVCHGTDTLAYTAAALSYLIQNSRKPVVVTGAQKPIDKDVTDARTNLLDSFIYAADDASQNVNIVFDGKVIVGTRARKERAKSYNAFSSINFPYPARIQDGVLLRYIPEIPLDGPVQFYHSLNSNICVFKLIPGARPDLLQYLFSQYDCLIIESFGVGGIPDALLETFYNEMEQWQKKGKVVVIATQVANEGSDMSVYEVGRRAKRDFDLIETYDMTLEATVTKLMWLLAEPHTDYGNIRERFYRAVNHDTLFSQRRRFQ